MWLPVHELAGGERYRDGLPPVALADGAHPHRLHQGVGLGHDGVAWSRERALGIWVPPEPLRRVVGQNAGGAVVLAFVKALGGHHAVVGPEAIW